MALIELKMPALGEGIIEATVLKWLKQVGDTVEDEEMVLEIATDKVDSEVPSTATGTIKKLLFKENEVAPIGATIAIIEGEGTSTDTDAVASTPEKPDAPAGNEVEDPAALNQVTPASALPDVSSDSEPEDSATATDPAANVPYLPRENAGSTGQSQPDANNNHNNKTAAATDGNNGNNGFYSPLVMSIAQKEGLNMQQIGQITGTGKEGRLTKKDILQYVENQPAVAIRNEPASASGASASKSPAKLGAGDEIIEMDRMRKLIAHHMKESQNISATVTSFAEVDVTHMVQWRNKIKAAFEEREKTKITFTPLFIDCVTRTIKRYPMINSSVDGDRIIVKKAINIGMATALPNGNLIVPVIKNTDHLNLVGLSKAVNETADKARKNQLKPADTQEGTFTLTNVGSFGSLTGTPIINQPQVAILAIGTIKKRPVVIETAQGDTIGIRHMMILSLSYDHRIIDGAMGSKFLSDVVKEIENWDLQRDF